MTKKYKEKLNYIHDLYQMARVDHNEALVESTLIERIASKMGVDIHDIEAMQEEMIETEDIQPVSEFERISNYYGILLVMCVDQIVDKEEILFSRELGLKMGLNPYAVDEVLDSMITNNFKPLPSEKITGIFKKFYN